MRPRGARGLGILGLAWLLATSALAGTPASLRISQALAEGTQVTVYVTVSDALGATLADETLTFHATLGTQVAEVVSSTPFAASGEGVLYLLLVDLSRSLDAATFERIRQALRDWVAALGQGDRAAILGFGTHVHTLVAPTADPAALNTAIEGLNPTEPHTALHEALAQGLILGQQRGADLPSRRALVVLSDGLDDAPGGMTAEEVEARLMEGAVPIYAVGFSRVRDRASREAGLAALGRFARLAGGHFIDASAGEPAAAYAAMRERIRAVSRLQVRCPSCVADGNRYRLQIALTQDGRTLSDGVDVRLYPLVAAGQGAAEEGPAAPAAAASPESVQAGTTPAAEATPTPAGAMPDASPPGAQSTPPAPAPPVIQPPSGLAIGWPWLLGALGLGLGLVLLVIGLMRRAPVAPSARPVPAPAPAPVEATPIAFTPPPPTGPVTVTQRPAAPAGPTLTLAYMGGRRRGEVARLNLAPDGIIGRNSACALALVGDDEVSARHARLFVQDRRLLLEDLGSTNGTWLNGVRLLAPTPLREGDLVRVGQTELRLGKIGDP